VASAKKIGSIQHRERGRLGELLLRHRRQKREHQ
jgi:hypothetical protein